ncbi:MAG: hypothetical protein Q8O67_10595 [Deltaproteobacteria bacterium]|nr:hypothetical protein [Deltaproteobacteria bacterium]
MAAIGLAFPAQAKGFDVEIVSGIEQKRKLSTPRTTAIPRVRKLSPGDEVITVVVKVPDGWLKAPPATEAAAVVVAQNAGEIDEVIKALRALKLVEPKLKPTEIASRIAGVFQVADDGSALRPLDARLWHAWEVLVDAEHADTLSAAVASVQALEQLSIKARVCSYPSEGGAAFGVVVDGTDSATELVPMHPRGKPKTLSTSSMHCSTVKEVSDPAFKPGGGVTPIPVPTPTSPTTPPPPRVIEPPSLEDQVDALGLDPLEDDRLWYGLSAVGILAVFLVAGFAMGTAVRRSRRAQKLAEQRKQRQF